MKKYTRASIAFIAGSLISNIRNSSIYDYSMSKHLNISGEISPSKINIYDYERKCYIGGNIPSLFDYGNNKHINLEINGNHFEGYDYDTQKHFSGEVVDNSISLYDYETSRYYSYSI